MGRPVVQELDSGNELKGKGLRCGLRTGTYAVAQQPGKGRTRLGGGEEARCVIAKTDN